MPRPRRRALLPGAAIAGAVVVIAAITAFAVLGLPVQHRQVQVTRAPTDASPQRLNCAAKPSSCGYPDQSNTGVAAGTQLRASGSVFATEQGQIVEGLSITGELVVAASGVTIRNVRIVGGKPVGNGDWVIVIRPGVTDVLIENVDIGTRPGSEQDIACILNLGDAVPVVRHANVHGCTAGISSGGGVVEDSYLHDPSEVPGVSHIVGIASNGGGGLTVRHNTILNPFGQTAAVAFYQDFGTQSDNLVEDNLVAGGGYCFYGGSGDRGGTRDIRFLANRLSRKYSPECGHFGVLASFAWTDPGNVFAGNFWDETGVEVVP